MPSASKLDEVRVLIVSFLVARPGWTPITVLDNDYYNFEKNRIPFHQFGFASLLEFLQSMPQHFQLEKRNGHCHIRAFTSEKSKHVSSLVSRQRKPSKFTTPLRHRTSTYIPYVPRQRPKIPAEQLNNLVQYVRNNPEGINIISAMQMIQRTLPYVKLTEADIRDQLRELEHQVYITDDIIRPVGRSTFSSQSSNFNNRSRSPLMASEAPYNASESSTSNVVYTAPKPSTPNTVYTVPEECHNLDMDDMDDMDFVRPSNAQHSKRPKTDERLASSLKEHSDYKPTFNYYEYERQEKCNNIENIDDYFMKQEMVGSESDGLLNLVSERMRSRLEQLMQDYPDGILCSELPKLYLAKYNVSLNYADLGFNSVINFTSHLPDIFYARRENTYSDFILYSADKRPKHQDAADGQRISQDCDQETTSKMKPIDVNSPPKSHDMRKDNEPIPLDLSPDVLHKFAPENATTYEHISHILVTDLKRQVDENKNKFLEVYIVEVFTPSFFWIHLRKNTKQFDKFMKELGTFYNHSCQTYAIPKLGLQRGLNCACVFAGMWHRGVVKNVKPDFRVTIMFYDYGTQKTYAPEEIYYLDKRFTDLPAQAIPCGLYNVKPYVGERWKKSITDRFIDRISDSVLAATIVTIDPPNNSMMIVLSDTSEEEDVHINDWLVQENLARSGKMGETVDMTSLSKYVVNSINMIPSYCYAEENLMIDSCSKSTPKEEVRCETPLLSPGASHNTCHENNQQQPPPHSRPPGFTSDFDRFNTPTNFQHTNVYSATNNNPSRAKTPSMYSDFTEMTSNLFVDGNPQPSAANATSDVHNNDIDKQIFERLMQEGLILQIHLTDSFRRLLKPPLVVKNQFTRYIDMLIQVNRSLSVLVTEVQSQLSDLSQNCTNNLDAFENFVNQETSSSPRPLPTYSPSNPFGNHWQSQHAAFTTSNTPPPHARNFEQASNRVDASSYQADMNDPRIQSPSVTCGPESPMFNSRDMDMRKFIQEVTQQVVSALKESNVQINVPHVDPPSRCHHYHEMTHQNEDPTKLKETNPFRLYQNVEPQIPVRPSERSDYDVTNLASCLSGVNLQSHGAPTMDANTNSQTTSYNFCATNENTRSEPNVGFESTRYNANVNSYGDYAPRIVYEAKPVMYNLQKKPEEQQLPPQLSSPLQGGINNSSSHVVPSSTSFDAFALNNERYVTPMTHKQKPLSTSKNYYQPEIDSNVLPSHVSVDVRHNAMLQNNNDPIQDYRKSSVSPRMSPPTNLLPQKEFDDKLNSELVNADSHRTTEPNVAPMFNDYENATYTNWENSSLAGKVQERTILNKSSLNETFLFQQINSVEGVTILFHVDNDGWMLINEFVQAFAKFNKCSTLMTLLDVTNTITKKVDRSDHPMQFLQLDSYPLNVVRDSENRIISIDLISLQAALGLLCKLKIISREEIENIFKRTDTTTENPAMFNIRTLLATYKNFRYCIEQCNVECGT